MSAPIQQSSNDTDRTTGAASPDPTVVAVMVRNWVEEMDAAAMYHGLAKTQRDAAKHAILEQMRDHELTHAAFWKERILELGGTLPHHRRSVKILGAPIVVRIVGLGVLLSSLEVNEQAGIIEYLHQSRSLNDEKARKIALDILPSEKQHLALVAKLARGETEGLNENAASRAKRLGETVRDLIFGLNDGLLSNLSLIAGVSGANPTRGVILLAGVAGLIAGMFSMAVGQYLSTKSEHEILDRSRQLNVEEIRTVPELKRDELKERFADEGLPHDLIPLIVEKVTANEESWLLAIGTTAEGTGRAPGLSPLSGGAVTGIGFAIGAIVPLIPYIFANGTMALILAAVLSGAALFFVGALKSFFTARTALHSGLEMLGIGAVAAIVTNGIGRLFGVAGIV